MPDPRRLALLLAALCAGVGLASCRRPEAAVAPGPDHPPLAVGIARVTAVRLPVLVEAPGTVRPAHRASIAAKLTGTVAAFPHGLGAVVPAGEVLLTLHAPEVEARVDQARALLAEAERHASRQRTLVASGVNPPEAERDAEDRLRYAQAALAEAEALLASATIQAPFDGVITEKHVLAGDLATPGMPLLAFESTQHLRVEGAIPEQAAAALRPGAQITVVLDGAADALSARLEEISAAADVLSRSVLVKAALPAGAGRSGQFARLQVLMGEEDALLVPRRAIARLGQMERAFAVVDGRAVLRLVKSGRLHGDDVEILAGLQAGDSVVVAPPAGLRDGQPVTAAP